MVLGIPNPFKKDTTDELDEHSAPKTALASVHMFHTPVHDMSAKPVESVPKNDLGASNEDMAKGLQTMVEHSASTANVRHGIHMHASNIFEIPWISKLIPGIEKLAAEYHLGNFVAVRGTTDRFFESMPIYARIGMHLLFYGKPEERLLGSKTVEEILKEQSIKQGKIYDSAESVASIPSFISTYEINLEELLQEDLTKYATFNDFFHRQLKPDARPVERVDDKAVICSAADCRLTVYPTVTLSQKFWIKGKHFDIPTLLGVSPLSRTAQEFSSGSLAIFRLAPSDYHRFHSPIDGSIGEINSIEGEYYTVNPQAVNEEGFDVFTANVRSILYLTHTTTQKRVAFVAIGALLVGGIVWTQGREKGTNITRGEELGYFAYGGSTVIAIFPEGLIEFDADLVKNSEEPIETLMKVGYSIGQTII